MMLQMFLAMLFVLLIAGLPLFAKYLLFNCEAPGDKAVGVCIIGVWFILATIVVLFTSGLVEWSLY